VAVPAATPRSALCVAIQAPVMRASVETAQRWLPALQRAAQALCAIDADAPPARSASTAASRSARARA